MRFQTSTRPPPPLHPRVARRQSRTVNISTSVLQAQPGTASQSPPRPGPPRYLLPRYPLTAALGPGFASPPSPTSARSTTPNTQATAPCKSGGERLEDRRARNGLGAVSHLWMEKGHAARFGLVLIRAVRHLGVKSLLPLHAGRKRFTLAGFGQGGGRARGRARAPPEATRPPPPPPSLPPVTPPLPPPPSGSTGPCARARVPARPGPSGSALCCTAPGQAGGRLWAWALPLASGPAPQAAVRLWLPRGGGCWATG